jgi:hypothetical protein
VINHVDLLSSIETKIAPRSMRIAAGEWGQSWPGESGHWGKWIFCLIAAQIAAD